MVLVQYLYVILVNVYIKHKLFSIIDNRNMEKAKKTKTKKQMTLGAFGFSKQIIH